MFEIFDQGYSEVKESSRLAGESARRLLAVAAAAFVLTAALVLFLALRSMAPGARSMRLLGVRQGVVWREMAEALAALILVSALLGGGAGAALYRLVISRLVSESVAFRPEVLALCAAGLAMVLLLAAAAFSLPVAARGLIQTMGGKQEKGGKRK